jgi:hypothetical protein
MEKMAPSDDEVRTRFIETPIAPHLLFFWIFNLIYFLPILVVYLSGYVDSGAADAIALLDAQTLRAMSTIYAEGIVAFTVGSMMFSLFHGATSKARPRAEPYPALHYGIAVQMAVVLIAGLFICTKAALAPLGVYHAYAAETGAMTGGIWSFSMFCAECVVLASIFILYSDSKRNVLGFVLLSAINGINLLHGTRIIFIVNVLTTALYFYMRGKLSLKRMLVLGPAMFVIVLAMTYAVFLSREGLSLDGELSFARTLSPIVYESIFSQLSLGNVIKSPDVLNSTGALPNFLIDVIASTTPRILLPDKDTMPYITKFAYMSPMGALNGYAAGAIYFGVFWPLFYLCLGGFASWLYSKAKTNAHWLILYVYFSSDVLFRFMRDGYLIPLKIFIDMSGVLIVLFVFESLIRGLSEQLSHATNPRAKS